ncbi:MAG TPA: 50S ribosomal protein L18e [Methanomassiliicoccaceae archaeon]|jgi:large subunit ribosomal protein L18e|nr:50S ribosomal protein L18e [Methanomassiliicoccaceae archaeon]HOL06718.1 50S ribosomal protein L18e [Methanomassiliicoccaceae archaeon]
MFIRDLPVSASYDNVEGVRMKTIRKTDPNLVALINDLKRETREREAAIWRDIAQRLEKPSRNWAEVNLSRLERLAQDGDVIVVPGKVLGAGSINKKITVAAFKFSASAAKAIEEAGGKRMTIPELVKENPSGNKVRIMG